jgi:hypothetical protein
MLLQTPLFSRWSLPLTHRGATGSWVGATTCHFYLSSAGTGYPSRRHRKLGGGRPRATHLRERKLPGRRVSPRKLCTISGPESNKLSHVLFCQTKYDFQAFTVFFQQMFRFKPNATFITSHFQNQRQLSSATTLIFFAFDTF